MNLQQLRDTAINLESQHDEILRQQKEIWPLLAVAEAEERGFRVGQVVYGWTWTDVRKPHWKQGVITHLWIAGSDLRPCATLEFEEIRRPRRPYYLDSLSPDAPNRLTARTTLDASGGGDA